MTLPLAVVSRWPNEEYQKQHTDIVSALKHNVGDALKLYRDLEQLGALYQYGSNKESKGHDKKLDALKKLSSKLNLADRVFIVGPQKDVHTYLSASDIFCLPSLYDSLPNALLEALCCGLPAVITKDVGISETVSDAQAGIITTRNPEHIQQTIMAAWDNYDLLSNNALALSKEFDINLATQKWIALYEKIIQKKNLEKNCS